MRKYLAAALLLLLVTARPSSAQTPLGELIENFILTGITLPGGNDPGSPHAGHFTLGNPTFGNSQGASRADQESIAAVEAFNDRFRAQVANFPLGSSSGGFTYTYDPVTREYSRGSNSFGPAFAERAATIGRHKVSLGFNYQHSSFDTFGGKELGDGSIVFYLPHTDCCNAAAPPPSPEVPGFEGDILEASLKMKATADTFVMLANYGLTDRLDVGVAVPISRLSLDVETDATIIRLSSSDNHLVHTFVQGQDVSTATFTDSGTASGLGDVVARAKYTFIRSGQGGGLAAAVDLRLPTGDEANLLGLGATQAKLYLIASSSGAHFAPHVNIGYTVSGEGNTETEIAFQGLGASNEFNYTFGTEVIPHPRLTIMADILGRTLFDAGNLEDQGRTFEYRVGAAAPASAPLLSTNINPLTGREFSQLALTPGNLTLVLGTVGAKFNVAQNLLISGNVLFPLNKAGLRDRATITFGLDYAF